MSLIYHRGTGNRRDFVAKILNLYKDSLKSAKKAFIKPNIVSSEPYPTTTHPEVLDALLRELANREIVVGDAPAIDRTCCFADIEVDFIKHLSNR